MTGTLTELRHRNPDFEILTVDDPQFVRYGRVIEGLPLQKVVSFAKENAVPGEGTIYERRVAGLEADEEFARAAKQRVYGGMSIQVGWCYGRNLRFDRLEYHKGPETLVAVNDILLFLGLFEDLDWGDRVTYDSSHVEAFFVGQGTAVELCPWCLHLAPCHVHEETGFRTLVVLPEGTNEPLDFQPGDDIESALLAGRNKWRLVHPEAEALVRRGAYVGIEGQTLTLQAL